MIWRRLPGLATLVAGIVMPFAASTAVHAETLPVSGVYPAESDGAAALNRIALESFGGLDGAAVSIALGDRLRGVRIAGQPYFTIVPAGMGGHAEGVMRGTAAAQVQRQHYSEEHDGCTDMDGDGKCVKRGKIKVRCERRSISLDASIRLVADNGDLLYASEEPVSQAASRCSDSSRELQPVEDVVRNLAGKLADNIRFGVAPVERSEDVRVMENRKGLPRELQPQFKDAVHLTKNDPAAACREWQAIDQASQNDLSTVFNLGLCAESQGRLGEAERRYRQALSLKPGEPYAAAGLRRIEDRMRADRQLAVHHGA